MNGSSPSSSNKKGWFSFMGEKWPRLFFFVTMVQIIICLVFEAYVSPFTPLEVVEFCNRFTD